MEGLRAILNAKFWRRKAKMKWKPVLGIVDSNDDGTHGGIKTIDVQNRCEFSGSSDICLCIVTWNMNGQVSYEDIEKLVSRDRKFDLLAIGLQEVPRKNISQLLKDVLVDTHTLLGKALMQSLQLYVFGPKTSNPFVRELKVDKHPVGGFGGLIRRKKGAVAIRINYKGIRILFISCHLAGVFTQKWSDNKPMGTFIDGIILDWALSDRAHARNVEERNDQFRNISHSIFSQDWNPYARPAQITVWMGDLNYRLEGINTFPARDLIQENLHGMLTPKDQLLQEAERGQIFNGYYEGTLAFKPTYKYNIGSSNYDTSYKVRVPSWTDRILFKIDDHNEINATLHSYESIDNIRSSDHKPVKAHLCLNVNKQQLSLVKDGALNIIPK